MIKINNNWEFTYTWSEEFAAFEGNAAKVRLPHNVKDMPLHYANPEIYETECGYRKILNIPKKYIGNKIFLQFDGAAHVAEVFLNGKSVDDHTGGYTSFKVNITDYVKGGDNQLVVKLDCHENPNIPPFGGVIDYLTYGGLYRDVWLDIRPQTYIEDIFVYTIDKNNIHIDIKIDGTPDSTDLEIYAPNGTLVSLIKDCPLSLDLFIEDPELWSVDNPLLYSCIVRTYEGDSEDILETTFGVRVIDFRPDGFYLNGEKVFLRGLNRHQCYPTIGYAASESLQREDARILKEELCCNAVRTSHYPQSKYFIDECDRLGLLVFTEIPGWQHIGDKSWQNIALKTTAEMVLQYRNHPSIILWGVRINESQDDDDFYKKTNKIAHELDPSRPTSGVRFIEKSHLLEDVYAYNDFSYDGNGNGCRPKKAVVRGNKPLLISESNGHMFPTKSFDEIKHRQEQALRHASVLNSALASGDHIGCFQWCMFDYPTHKDFGSGNRICYHGVLDQFRNPKLAASLYASQGEYPMLEVGTNFESGDYPAFQKGKIYAFTNADEIKLYKNDVFVKSFSNSAWKSLSHGPIEIDDTIGDLLKSVEGFDEEKAKILRECLLSAEKHGLANMPLKDKLKLGKCMLKYKMRMQDGVDLYGKYIGNWGEKSTSWRVDAIKDGNVVCSKTFAPSCKLHLDVKVSKTHLTDGDAYDMSLIRIRILDENNNVASYAQMPVAFATEGMIKLHGPSVVTAEGGMCGTIISSDGVSGEGKLFIYTENGMQETINFNIESIKSEL